MLFETLQTTGASGLTLAIVALLGFNLVVLVAILKARPEDLSAVIRAFGTWLHRPRK